MSALVSQIKFVKMVEGEENRTIIVKYAIANSSTNILSEDIQKKLKKLA